MVKGSGRADAVQAVAEVFRYKGFEGASLSELAAATGLGRSSLYHYFPGGKADMAGAALASIEDWLALTFARMGEVQGGSARWSCLQAALDEFYAGGRQPCLLGAFAVGNDGAAHSAALSAAMSGQVALFEDVAKASGLSSGKARQASQDAAARLQGALILTRLLDDPEVFGRALRDIGTLLLKDQ